MKKIKKSTKPQQNKPMDLRTKILISAVAGVLVILAVILMFIENDQNQMIIRNNSDLKLEYIKAYFVDEEGPVNDSIEINGLEPGKKIENAMERVNLYAKAANLELRFKFAGYDDKLLVDSGIFNDVFDGKITINFTQKNDDLIQLTVKASNGLLPSTLIRCDEVYDIELKDGEGYIEE